MKTHYLLTVIALTGLSFSSCSSSSKKNDSANLSKNESDEMTSPDQSAVDSASDANADAWPCARRPFVGSSKACRFQLENGLKVILVEDHSSATFAYQTWFDVGSRDEVVGRTGLAHLFEHMMFKGTSKHPEGEFDKIMEEAGSEGTNAFTSRDYTAYIQELPSTQLKTVMELESDRMRNLIVNDQSFSTEREVVQNERRMRNENSPDGLMYQELFEGAFTQHSYHWPVIGYEKDLAQMSAQDAREFYQIHYSPNRATLIIVGDINPSEVRSMVERHYGSIEAGPVWRREIPHDPPRQQPFRKTLKLNTQVEKLMMGYHTPEFAHADTAALNVLQIVLGDGKSSRLHKALVSGGLASRVSSYEMDDNDPSLFVVDVSMQKGKKAALAETAVLNEIDKVRRMGISQRELEKAKNRFLAYFYRGLDSNAEKARYLGTMEIVGRSYEAGLQMLAQVQATTREDVQRAVNAWFRPNNRVIILGVPK